MKPILLKTQRLTIRPFGPEELQAYIDTIADPGLHSAYKDIHRKVHGNPENYPWYTYWQVSDARGPVGGILFYGIPNKLHEVSISFGIEDEFRDRGYEQETISAIRKWVYKNTASVNEGGRSVKRHCYYLLVKNEISDVTGRRQLEEVGFRMLEPDENNPESAYFITFIQEAPRIPYTGIGLAAGTVIGLAIAWILQARLVQEGSETLLSATSLILPCLIGGAAIGLAAGILADVIRNRARKIPTRPVSPS